MNSSACQSVRSTTLQVLAECLLKRNWRLSSCESCTGGWIGKVLTDMPGSSAWYEGGLITYSNALKQKLAGVQAGSLDTYGAVSETVAAEMAQGCQQVTGSQFALAVTGVAGPGGGSPEKPVGMVCFGWCVALPDQPTRVLTQTQFFNGDRLAVRAQTVDYALGNALSLVSDS